MRSLLLFGLLLGAPTAGASSPAPVLHSAPSELLVRVGALQAGPDSAALHERARDAQARFERRRRDALPRTGFSGGGEGRCDEVVGRFCLRFQGGEEWEPEPEPPEIIQAREDLLDTLAAIGRQIPGDTWVKGQRVHYLGEEGRWGEALEVVGPCDAPEAGWRCHALRGYTLHRSDRFEDARRSFEEALAGMDRERREDWRDPEVILDRRADDVWDEAGEGRREALRRRLWVLSDPLYLVPGNDRRTEHLARHASAWIREDARTPYGISWGWDLAELLVRYGSEMGWERERARATSLRRGSIVGHHHPESRQYVPPGEVFEAPVRVDAGDWTLEAERPRSSYAPSYAPELESRPFQVAVFRRGEEMVVVAGYRLPPDTAAGSPARARGGGDAGPPDTAVTGGSRGGGDSATREPTGEPEKGAGGLEGASDGGAGAPTGPSRAGLFLLNPDSAEMRASRRAGRDSGGLAVRAPVGRYLASVEVWSPDRARAVRSRVGVGIRSLPPDVAALSDLLLLDSGPELPQELEAAIPRARARLRACTGESVAVGWELYGLGLRRESVRFRLRLQRTDRGFFERAGEWLGLGEESAPVTLEWTEPGPERLRPFFRAVDLTLPPDAEPGSYLLRLEADLSGRTPLRAERRIRVVDDPGACPGSG